MSKNTQEKAPSKVEYNDAVAESKRYFDGDELAATVWVLSLIHILDELPLGSHEGPAGLFLVGPAGAAGCGEYRCGRDGRDLRDHSHRFSVFVVSQIYE